MRSAITSSAAKGLERGGLGKIDGEHTAHASTIAYSKHAAVRFDAPTTDDQPKTQARALGEDVLRWQRVEAAAFVLHLDEYAIDRRVTFQQDPAVWPGELEGVLKQIPQPESP
jgi:hypothetical protein